jgi:hypothetical protein
MSKALVEEVKAEAEKAVKVREDEKEILFKERGENRDWKRNGELHLEGCEYYSDAAVFR